MKKQLKVIFSVLLFGLLAMFVGANALFYASQPNIPVYEAGSGKVYLSEPMDVTPPWYVVKIGGGYGLAASGQVTLPFKTTGDKVAMASKAFAASQIDTVIVKGGKGVASVCFGVQWKDSVQLFATTAARVLRVVAGTGASTIVSVPAADTLTNWTNLTATTDGSASSLTFSNGNAALGSITLAPYPDFYLVIVKYAATGNGTTTPTAIYEAIYTYGATQP